jgi:hypothetical protein
LYNIDYNNGLGEPAEAPVRARRPSINASTSDFEDAAGPEATPTPAPRRRGRGHGSVRGGGRGRGHSHQEDPVAGSSVPQMNAPGGPSMVDPVAPAARASSRHSSSSTSVHSQQSNPPTSPTDSSADEAENFDHVFNDSPSPRRLSPPVTPSQATRADQAQTVRAERARGTPRFGRRSRVAAVARDGPAGNKKRHAAQDVWRFFTAINQRNHCVFCE